MSKKLQNAWFGLSIMNRIAPMDQIWIRESFLQYFESYHQKYISNRNKKKRDVILLFSRKFQFLWILFMHAVAALVSLDGLLSSHPHAQLMLHFHSMHEFFVLAVLKSRHATDSKDHAEE